MTGEPIILAVPSKGRLMDRTMDLFAAAGLPIGKSGQERGYQGTIEGCDGVEIAFYPASEIAEQLKLGRVHMGVTGEDLLRETIADADARLEFIAPLGYGHADVVVAVPECWIDVARVVDLEDMAASFRRRHGRPLRVATGYMNLTRRFLAKKGVASYRIVESVGATEGTPSAGTAEVIVDITSSGATLRANHLRVLDDGVILRSQANLVASRAAQWSPSGEAAKDAIAARIHGLTAAEDD